VTSEKSQIIVKYGMGNSIRVIEGNTTYFTAPEMNAMRRGTDAPIIAILRAPNVGLN
jgi:hypothetical protein